MKRFVWLLAAGALSCAAEPTPAPNPGVASPSARQRPPPRAARFADGAAALEQGDTIEAGRLFASVPESDPDYAKARTQLTALAPEINAIAVVWLKQVDRSVRAEHYQTAHKRLDHMLDHFALDDAMRTQVEQKLIAVDQEAAVAVANLETLDQQAPALVALGDLTHAASMMRRALQIARDAAPDTVLDRERRLGAIEQRLAATQPPPRQPEPVASAKKEGRRGRKRAEPAPAPTPPVVAAPIVVEEPEAPEPPPPPPESRAQGLLEEADAFRENKAYFNAIVGYLRVRSIERDNARAQAALNELEPKRQELVRGYLDSANQHFQQQDLAGAVPFYRKVLLLEPDNLQAKKGLEMHYNLERIRREKRAAQ